MVSETISAHITIFSAGIACTLSCLQKKSASRGEVVFLRWKYKNISNKKMAFPFAQEVEHNLWVECTIYWHTIFCVSASRIKCLYVNHTKLCQKNPYWGGLSIFLRMWWRQSCAIVSCACHVTEQKGTYCILSMPFFHQASIMPIIIATFPIEL